MKKGLLFSLILFAILFFGSIPSFIEFKNSMINSKEFAINLRKQCEKENYIGTEKEELCNDVIGKNDLYEKYDYITFYSNSFLESFKKWGFIVPLIVLIPSLIYICNYLKNNFIVNELTRLDYKKIKMKLFFKSYCSIWIIPLAVVLSLLVCAIYTKNFDLTKAVESGYWEASTLNNQIIFIFLYILNILIHCILYANIGIIVSRSFHNYFVSLIISFLVIIGLEAILEIIFGAILVNKLFNTELGIIFNIINFYAFNDTFGILSPLIIPTILMIISFIVINFIYKDKEKIIIDCSEND